MLTLREKNFRWREGEVIGQGAFGEVIMGFNEDNGQIMAVKQLNLKFLAGEEVKIIKKKGNLANLKNDELVELRKIKKNTNFAKRI